MAAVETNRNSDIADPGHLITSEESSSTSGLQKASPVKKDWNFAVVIFSLCLIVFLASLDGSIIATALPQVTNAVSGAEDNYVWIANCFLFAQTVSQPPIAQLCNIFGRRSPMLLSIALFLIGSGVAGGANSAAMLIAGRTVQGLGSGGIMLLVELIVCDIVPMRERGKYLGIVMSTAAIGAIVGPVVGGALAEHAWRWIFYLNLPIAGLVMITMILCLKLKYTREPTWARALARVDWVGSVLFIGSMCALLLGLVMGGTIFAWSSWRIILPLVLGGLGWIAFHIFESTPACREPSVPMVLFGNQTSVVGFFLVFVSSMLLQWAAFFIPFYFQAAKSASPLKAGINFLPFQAFIIPFASVAGGILSKTGVYRPLHVIGFGMMAIGVGLFTLLDDRTPTVLWVIFQAIEAIGQGLVIPTVLPAIQASLAESEVATSVGMYSFLRSFGFVWGTTIPGIIFNARWDRNSWRIDNANARAQMSNGVAYHYASGPFRSSLSQTTQAQVVDTYVASLKTVWYGAIAVAIVGFLAVFLEKHIPLRTELETEYGLEQKKTDESIELEKAA